MTHRAMFCTLMTVLWLGGCGGGAAQKAPQPTVNKSENKMAVPSSTEHFCSRPILQPSEVWPRIEAAKRLSNEELQTKCGLDFVLELAKWRTPPLDLLEKIVAAESRDFAGLEKWVRTYAASDTRAVEAVVAAHILLGVTMGRSSGLINQNRTQWQPLAEEIDAVKQVVNEALFLDELMIRVEEIHYKRCMLEVNPLGFAVSCTPIHPARQKIELSWHEEVRDGLIINLELSQCHGSSSCRKLKKVSREFLHLYLKTVDAAERLEAEVFKARLMQWLKVPPFSQGSAAVHASAQPSM